MRILSAASAGTNECIETSMRQALARTDGGKKSLFVTGGTSAKFWMPTAVQAATGAPVHLYLTDTFDAALATKQGRPDTNEEAVLVAGIAEALGRQQLTLDQLHLPQWHLKDPSAVADEYERQLIRGRGVPTADVVILSSGGGSYYDGGPVDPGHIAGIPHGQPELFQSNGSFLVVDKMPKPPSQRITMSPKLIRGASLVLLFILGEKKRNAFLNIQNDSLDPVYCPARLVAEHENALVITDLV